MNKQFLNNKDCQKIIDSASLPNQDAVALLNIGYLISNSIELAGQMIADAIRNKNDQMKQNRTHSITIP